MDPLPAGDPGHPRGPHPHLPASSGAENDDTFAVSWGRVMSPARAYLRIKRKEIKLLTAPLLLSSSLRSGVGVGGPHLDGTWGLAPWTFLVPSARAACVRALYVGGQMAGAGVMQRWAQTSSLLSLPPAVLHVPSHPSQPWYRPRFQQEETSSALCTVSTSRCPFPTLLGWMDGARAPDGLGLLTQFLAWCWEAST